MFGFGKKKLSYDEVEEHLDRLPRLRLAFKEHQSSAIALRTIIDQHAGYVEDVKSLGGKV